MEIPKEKIGIHKKSVHHVLAQSYFAFFLSVIAGLWLNTMFPFEIFEVPQNWLGMLFIALGTLLVLWSQATSRGGKKERRENKDLTHHHFAQGPYRFMRSPTHVGLTLLVLGYGFLINALMFVVTVFIFALISRLVFVKQEEDMLAKRYGSAYEEYKKRVRI